MSLNDWVSNTRDKVKENGLAGLQDSLYMVYTGTWRIIGSRLPLGSNIFDHEWDVLIVLDGCRVDFMKEFVGEFGYVQSVNDIISVGSTSREWLAKTFRPEYADDINSTTYITANPYSEEIFSSHAGSTRSPFNPANWKSVTADEFYRLEEVWRSGWDDSLGTVPPRTVTNHAINATRTGNQERLIIHYMQPHQPFIGQRAQRNNSTFKNENCWGLLRTNKIAPEIVKSAYRENLHLVLEEVELLLDNSNGKAVITSDHGNAFGELGIFGHPNGFLHPAVKRVPWVETIAKDSGEYEPPTKESSGSPQPSDSTTEDRLKNLGYL